MARLPRNAVGYPIPWFVAVLEDGTRDFRIASHDRQVIATRERLCWVCGGMLGRYVAFVIGPMCAVNRISAEPPSHRECAVYSATVCPFLVTPSMRRRPTGAVDTIPPAGQMLERNPGVTLVWVTRQYSWFRPTLGNDGVLYELGDPTETVWLHAGRPASREEILASIESGLPLLRDACQGDDDPARSLDNLEEEIGRAMRLVPA